MILNNIVDTLSNMTLPTSASLGNLSQVKTLVSGFKTTAIGIDPALTTLLNTTSQTVCEATITSAAELNNMQYIFALVFDTGII